MKNFLIVAFAAQITIASAITIQVDNSNGFDTNLVVDESGVLLTNTGSIVKIGHFGSLTDVDIQNLANGSPNNLVSSFTQVGSDISFSSTVSGFFSGSTLASLQPTETDELAAGKGLYLFIGNSTDLSSADEFLVFRYEDDFVATPSEGPATANLINGRGTLLIGGFNNYAFDNDSNGTTADVGAFNLVAIPEPSSSALLGLSGLALIMRRRR